MRNDDDRDAVIEQAGFLRRLARNLLYDRSAADDVVQQAWLLSLKRRPGSPVSLRAWLAGAVRNLSMQRIRAEERRAGRERTAACPGDSPSAQDTAARIELMRRVTDAVESLEEPFRTAILLRFFDDLPPREIARRLGVPVETVRSRVRRGLERMRLELDGGDRGSRGAFLGALIPLAGKPPLAVALGAGASGSAFSTWITGGVVMGKKLAVAAALVVAGTAAWLLHDGATEPGLESGEGSAGAVSARAPQAEESTTAPAAAPISAPERTETADATETWTVAGRAFLGSNDRAPDVPVALKIEPVDGAASVENVVRTDARGHFTWTTFAPSGSVTVHVGSGDPVSFFAYPGATWVPASTAAPDDLVVHLHPIDCDLRGLVLDGTSAPVSGAEVWTLYGRTLTDGSGRFEVKGSSLSRTNYLTARAEGLAQMRIAVDPPGPGVMDGIEIVLRREMRMEGTVRDSDGDLVEDAVIASLFGAMNMARSDANGRYVLEHLDPARSRWLVYAEKEGFALTEAWVEMAGNGTMHRDFILDQGVRISGKVVDEDGHVVEGALLNIGFAVGAFNGAQTVSRSDGTFVFEHATRGDDQRIFASRAGYAPSDQELVLPVGKDVLEGVEIVLRRGHWLEGLVTDTAGRPLDNVIVQAFADQDQLGANARTDETGRFRMEDLAAETSSLRFYRRGLQRKHIPLQRLDRDVGSIAIAASGRLGGQVVDAVSGAPVTSFTIRFTSPTVREGEKGTHGYDSSWSREGHHFENEDGHWEAVGLSVDAGTIVGVEVSAPGYSTAVDRHVVVVEADAPLMLVHRLARGARIVGQIVRRGTDLPVVDAIVRCYPLDVPIGLLGGSEMHRSGTARTNEYGLFILEGMASGPTRLQVILDDGRTVEDGPFDVPRAGAVERRIEVSLPGVITGTLLDSSGRTLANEQVVLVSIDVKGGGGRDRHFLTDEQGRFRFDDVAGGVYQVLHLLAIGGEQMPSVSTLARLEDGGSTDVLLRPRGRCRITGTLTAKDDVVPEFLRVRALLRAAIDPTDRSSIVGAFRGTIARDGSFSLDGLQPGVWTLTVTHGVVGDGLQGEKEVDVAAGGEVSVQIELELR